MAMGLYSERESGTKHKRIRVAVGNRVFAAPSFLFFFWLRFFSAHRGENDGSLRLLVGRLVARLEQEAGNGGPVDVFPKGLRRAAGDKSGRLRLERSEGRHTSAGLSVGSGGALVFSRLWSRLDDVATSLTPVGQCDTS